MHTDLLTRFAGVSVILLLVAGAAYAFLPQLHVLSWDASVGADGVIRGSYAVIGDAGVLPNATIRLELIDGKQNILWRTRVHSLDIGTQRIERPLALALPPTLGGQLTARLEIVNDYGLLIAWSDAVVDVPASSRTVLLRNYGIVNGSERVPALLGPTSAPDAPITIAFDTDSGDGSPVDAVIDIREFGNEGPVVASTRATVAPRAGASFTVQLPPLSRPGPYAAMLRLVGADGQLSSIAEIRIVISGADATVWSVQTDKATYAAGETALVDLAVSAAADLSQLGDVTLRVSVLDNDVVAGVGEQQLDLQQFYTVRVPVPLSRSVTHVAVEVDVVKNGGVVEHRVTRSALIAPLPVTRPPMPPDNTILFIAGGAIVIVVILFLWFRNRRQPLFLLIAFLLLASTANAWVLEHVSYEFCGPFNNINTPYNSPPERRTVILPGDYISVSGTASVPCCGNVGHEGMLKAWITDDDGRNQWPLWNEPVGFTFLVNSPGALPRRYGGRASCES